MSINLTINGISYSFPTVNEVNWGQAVTSWASAITNGVLQKSGGTFQLLADVDFGTSYGLKSIYYVSRAAAPAQSGVVRLGNAEVVGWRNVGNTADFTLGLNATDVLASSAPISAPSIITSGTVTTPLTTGLVHSSAGVLTSSLLVDADVDAAAAISRSKLAAGSANHVVINNGSGVLSSEASLSPVRGGTGLTAVTTGDLLIGSGVNTMSALPIGTPAQVLTISGGVPTWQNPVSGFADPLTTAGDIIYKNGTALTTRLPVGSNGTILTVSGGLPTYSNTITNATEYTNSLTLSGTPVTANPNKINLGSNGAANRLVLRGENTRGLILSTGSLTADRTLTAPDVTGTIVTTGDVGSITSTMIANDTIGDADINSAAGIQGTKILPASGSQWGVVTTAAQTFAGAKTLSDTTVSTSTTTGALVVSGGLGVALAANINGDVNIGKSRGSDGASTLNLKSATASADYDGRILRAAGVNGNFFLENAGTGSIIVSNVLGTGTGNGALIQGVRNPTVFAAGVAGATVNYGAAAGYVGECIRKSLASTTSLVNATGTAVVTLNLTTGVWLVNANVQFRLDSGAWTDVNCGISTGLNALEIGTTAFIRAPNGSFYNVAPTARVFAFTAASTPVYLNVSVAHSGGVSAVGDNTSGNSQGCNLVAVRIA